VAVGAPDRMKLPPDAGEAVDRRGLMGQLPRCRAESVDAWPEAPINGWSGARIKSKQLPPNAGGGSRRRLTGAPITGRPGAPIKSNYPDVGEANDEWPGG
jgi:hypothetical protein